MHIKPSHIVSSSLISHPRVPDIDMILQSRPQLPDQLVEPLRPVRVRKVDPAGKICHGVDGLVLELLLLLSLAAPGRNLEQEVHGKRNDDPGHAELVVPDRVDDGPEAGGADEALGDGEDLRAGLGLLLIHAIPSRRCCFRHFRSSFPDFTGKISITYLKTFSFS